MYTEYITMQLYIAEDWCPEFVSHIACTYSLILKAVDQFCESLSPAFFFFFFICQLLMINLEALKVGTFLSLLYLRNCVIINT